MTYQTDYETEHPYNPLAELKMRVGRLKLLLDDPKIDSPRWCGEFIRDMRWLVDCWDEGATLAGMKEKERALRKKI